MHASKWGHPTGLDTRGPHRSQNPGKQKTKLFFFFSLALRATKLTISYNALRRGDLCGGGHA